MPRGYKTLNDDAVRVAFARINAGEGTEAVAADLGVTYHCIYHRGRALGLRKERQRLPQMWRPSRLALPLDPAALAYLAAMIDGEGHLSRYVPKRDRPDSREVAFSVAVSNTSMALMDWLRPFGGTIRRKSHFGNFPVYEWKVCAKREILDLLTAVEPYMIIKRAKAQAFMAELGAALR